MLLSIQQSITLNLKSSSYQSNIIRGQTIAHDKRLVQGSKSDKNPSLLSCVDRAWVIKRFIFYLFLRCLRVSR